jgi:hypothetical protein
MHYGCVDQRGSYSLNDTSGYVIDTTKEKCEACLRLLFVSKDDQKEVEHGGQNSEN